MNVFEPEPNGSEWNIYDIIEDIQRLRNHFYNYSLIHRTRELISRSLKLFVKNVQFCLNLDESSN